MALTCTTALPLIIPVYGNIDISIGNPSADYLQLDIYIGDASKGRYQGDKRSLQFIGTHAEPNIKRTLQSFFASDASAIPVIKRFDLVAKSFTSGVESSTYVDNFYVYNGTQQIDVSGFINNWNADIDVHPTDTNVNLYLFQGVFSNSIGPIIDRSLLSIKITKDGVATGGIAIAHNDYPQIYKLKIDPSTLGTSTNKVYTVDVSTGVSYLKTINVQPIKYGHFIPKKLTYVDRNGAINSVNIDLGYDEQIDITKNLYNANGTFKSYNTQYIRTFTATTDWMSESQATYFTEIYTSPSVIIDGAYVNILDKSQPVLKQRPDRLISYTVSYTKAEEQLSQIQIN